MSGDLWAGAVAPGSVVAGYRVECRIGAGGMAEVFRAQDERLDRMVALKVMAPQWAQDPQFRQRFIAESRAAAKLDDPNVIPVYEAGEVGGLLFIAMRLVVGPDLRDLIYWEGPMRSARAVELLSPVASALDAAHRAGLIHRDVKPANILIHKRPGHPDHVYLSDFGLSKNAAPGAVSLTGTGQFLGTPYYCSPEQCQGRPVDGHADQYALACVAYELLAGHVPFERDDPVAVLLAHFTEPPPPLTARRPDLPAAVDPVMARALAKSPGDRYPTCRDFTEALRGALGLETYGSPRKPAGRASADPAHAVAPSKMVDPGTKAPGSRTPPYAAGDIARHAERRPAASNDQPPSAGVNRARLSAIAAIGVILVASVIVALVTSQPKSAPGTPEPFAFLFTPAGSNANSLAFSPDGRTIGAGTSDGGNYLWNAATHKITATFTTHDGSGTASELAFSPDGRTIATTVLNSYLWNSATHKIIATLADPSGAASGASLATVAFSPDGRTVATGDDSGYTYLWNAATHKIIATLADPGSRKNLSGNADVSSVVFSPDGHTIATLDSGQVYLWNAAKRKITATLTGPPGANLDGSLNSVAFSPDGRMIAATAEGSGSVYLWNAATHKLAATLGNPYDPIDLSSVAFSPNGRTIATGNNDGNAYLWNVATRKIIATLNGSPPDAGSALTESAVAFSPDGHTIATEDGEGGQIDLWHLASS